MCASRSKKNTDQPYHSRRLPPKQFWVIVNNVRLKSHAELICRSPSAEDAVRGSGGGNENANRE
jgi:hypothetical protein